MANTDSPFGFRPVGHLNGSSWNGKVNMYYVIDTYGTAMFVGDPVITTEIAGGAAGVTVAGIDVEGMVGIAVGTATTTLTRGVIVGFLPNPANLEQLYKPASQARIALVCDDPSVIYEVQEDSAGGALTGDHVAFNCDMITYAAGRTITGRSLMALDSSVVTSIAAQWRILGLSKRPGNILGSFAKWLVVLNEGSLKGLVAD